MLLIVAALAGGCAAPLAVSSLDRRDEGAVSVWVLDHGWHTAIVLRRADVEPALWPEVEDFPEATFVEVAWGDRDFYMAPSPSAWLGIRAAMRTRGSVLHVVGFDRPIAATFPGAEIVELHVPPRGFARLTLFVSDEHARDGSARAIPLAPGLHGVSAF